MQFTGQNFFKQQQELSIEDQSPSPHHSETNGKLNVSNIPAPSYRVQGIHKRRFYLFIGAVITLFVTLTPIYVVRQLSIMSKDQLRGVLQSFIFALVLDLVVLRFLLIIVLSLVQARLKLKGIGSMVPVNPPKSVLAEDQLLLLGEFYNEYDTGYAMLASASENSARAADDNNQYSEEDDNNRNGIDHRNFGSSTRKLLLHSQRGGDDTATGERLHFTQLSDIYFIEIIIPHKQVRPTSPVKLVEQEIFAQITPGDDQCIEIGFQGTADLEQASNTEQVTENLANNSKQFIGISRPPSISSKHQEGTTPGRKVTYGFQAEVLLQEGLSTSTKVLKINQSVKVQSNYLEGDNSKTLSHEDSIEEINIQELPKGDRLTYGSTGHGNNRVPSLNMALVPINKIETKSQRKDAQQEFETPKKSPVQESKVFQKKGTFGNDAKSKVSIPASKKVASTHSQQQLSQQNNRFSHGTKSKKSIPSKVGSKKTQDAPIDPDLNASQLDQKKKLLRDLILEASSNDTKCGKENKKENQLEEFQSSLEKYLAEDSTESIELDANGNPIRVKKLIAPGILNDSDIQALWQGPSGTKKVDHYSPKYSSGNKSTNNPFKNGLASKVAPHPDEQRLVELTKKGTASIGTEEGNNSFKQNHQLRSSSHQTNLLRSVLSQNRENEAVDLSELVQGTDNKKQKNNGFNSPQERNKTPPLDGSQLKRMKCASIIVKEQQNSLQRQGSVEYDAVQVLEDEAVVIENMRDSDQAPVRFESQSVVQQKDNITVFQSEIQHKTKEEFFDQLLMTNNQTNKHHSEQTRITATPNASEDVQPQNIKTRQSSPIKRFGNNSPTKNPPLKRDPPSYKPQMLSSSSRRRQQEDQIRQNIIQSAQKQGKNDLFAIKESSEYASSIGIVTASNFTKVHPSHEKTYTYSMKFSSDRNLNNQSDSIHTFISAYPGGKMSNRPSNFHSLTKKTGQSDTILEEKSLDTGTQRSPSGSPPVVLRDGGKGFFEQKTLQYQVVQDNAFMGDMIREAPELTALRRSTKRNNDIAITNSMRPNSILVPEEASGIEISFNDKRYTSNIRPSEKPDLYKPKLGGTIIDSKRTNTAQSNTRPALKKPSNTVYVPQYFDQFKPAPPKAKQEPPPEYNLHLKEQEQQKQIKEKKEVGQIMIEEQERQLKKFLQLARQLRKGKDERKIMQIMASMKETGKPMSLQVINELRMLELMNSPYSQPLQGMIKTIEQCLNIKDERPQTTANQTKRKKRDIVKSSPPVNGDGSTRKLIKAFEAYNKREEMKSSGGTRNPIHQMASMQASSHLSQMTLSRESSAGNGSLDQNPDKKIRTKSATSWQRSHNRSQSNGSQQISSNQRSSPSKLKRRGGNTVDITDQSEQAFVQHQHSSNHIFSQLQSKNDEEEQPHSIDTDTQFKRASSVRSQGVRISTSPAKTPTAVHIKNKLSATKRSRGKRNGSKLSSKSSILSPSGSGTQMRRIITTQGINPTISHYSSINQVLVEHDEEESEVSHRQQQHIKKDNNDDEDTDLERGLIGSGRSNPVLLQEIVEMADVVSSPDK